MSTLSRSTPEWADVSMGAVSPDWAIFESSWWQIFFSKVAQMSDDFWSSFERHYFPSIICCGYVLGHSWKIWATFYFNLWSHWLGEVESSRTGTKNGGNAERRTTWNETHGKCREKEIVNSQQLDKEADGVKRGTYSTRLSSFLRVFSFVLTAWLNISIRRHNKLTNQLVICR